MEIAGAAQLAITKNLANASQSVGLSMMKRSLQQDAAVLQIVANATQAPALTAAPPEGVGEALDISV